MTLNAKTTLPPCACSQFNLCRSSRFGTVLLEGDANCSVGGRLEPDYVFSLLCANHSSQVRLEVFADAAISKALSKLRFGTSMVASPVLYVSGVTIGDHAHVLYSVAS